MLLDLCCCIFFRFNRLSLKDELRLCPQNCSCRQPIPTGKMKIYLCQILKRLLSVMATKLEMRKLIS
ncbi:unnamed protein product [Urochloa humidicola]